MIRLSEVCGSSLTILREGEFDSLGLCGAKAGIRLLTFCGSPKFLRMALKNPDISCLMVPPELAETALTAGPERGVCTAADLRSDFFKVLMASLGFLSTLLLSKGCCSNANCQQKGNQLFHNRSVLIIVHRALQLGKSCARVDEILDNLLVACRLAGRGFGENKIAQHYQKGETHRQSKIRHKIEPALAFRYPGQLRT